MSNAELAIDTVQVDLHCTSASRSRRPISLLVTPSESTSTIWRSRFVNGSCARIRSFVIFFKPSKCSLGGVDTKPMALVAPRFLVGLGAGAEIAFELCLSKTRTPRM
jgi:hypothetical protein